jgi:hypothetical protein
MPVKGGAQSGISLGNIEKPKQGPFSKMYDYI